MPDQQWVSFSTDVALTKELVSEKLMSCKKTMLTQFFALCCVDELARSICYPDVLRYFVYNAKDKRYKRRERNRARNMNFEEKEQGSILSETIGRIAVIPLNKHTHELFFLRTLLYQVKGPLSYEYLRTVDGICYDTFKKACVKMGLFTDDSTVRG